MWKINKQTDARTHTHYTCVYRRYTYAHIHTQHTNKKGPLTNSQLKRFNWNFLLYHISAVLFQGKKEPFWLVFLPERGRVLISAWTKYVCIEFQMSTGRGVGLWPQNKLNKIPWDVPEDVTNLAYNQDFLIGDLKSNGFWLIKIWGWTPAKGHLLLLKANENLSSIHFNSI